MKTVEKNYHAVCDLAESKGAEILFKHESLLMRTLDKVLFWLPKGSFMENYTTTIGANIYLAGSYSARSSPSSSETATITHELVHVEQFQRLGLVTMSFMYLVPQSLAVLSLFALLALTGNLWFLLFLLCLGFLAPIPAPWRMMYEVEAYATGFAAFHWVQGQECPSLSREEVNTRLSGYVGQFTGWSYYKMWPFKSAVEERLHEKLQSLVAHDWKSLPIVAREVYEVTQLNKVD